MPLQTDATTALDLIERDEFRPGPNWKKAHQIAQAHEGQPLFDAIHAFLHRIEGDHPNAAYWDRRANTDHGVNGPKAELARLREQAAQD